MKLHKILTLPYMLVNDLFLLMITYWPGPLGNCMRHYYYKRKLSYIGEGVTLDVGVHIINPQEISIGPNTHIDRFTTIIAGISRKEGRKIIEKPNDHYSGLPGQVHIGRNVHLAPYCYLQGSGGIFIGDNITVTSGTRIFSISHHYKNPADPNDHKSYYMTSRASNEDQIIIESPVVMEDSSFIGLNSVILPGTTIKNNSIISTLSSVTGTIESNLICKTQPILQEHKR